eukprot:SAG25_NODE_60_length_18113_cov_233.489952_18_plen_57_part_00
MCVRAVRRLLMPVCAVQATWSCTMRSTPKSWTSGVTALLVVAPQITRVHGLYVSLS